MLQVNIVNDEICILIFYFYFYFLYYRNTGFQASKNIAVDELGMEDLDAFFESPKKTSSTNSNTNNLASLLESGLNKPKINQLSSLFSQYNLTPEVSPPPPTQAEQEKISTKEKDGVQNKSPNIPASETQDTPTKVSSSTSKDKQPLSSLLNQFKPPQSTTNADTSANSTKSLFKPVSPTVSKPSSQPRRVSSPFVQSEFDQSEDMDMDISQESIADQGNTNERNKISTNPFASAIIPSEEEVTTTVEKSINVQQAQSKVTKSVGFPKAKTSSKQSAVLSAKATNIKVTKQVVASSSSSSNKSKPKAIPKQKPLLRSFSDLSQDASGGDSESEDDFPDFGTFSNSIGDSINKEAVSKTSNNNNSSTGANKTGSSTGKTLKNGNGEFLFSEAREEEDPFSISIEEGKNGDDDKSQEEEINKKSITTTNNKRGKKAAGKNANNINNKGPNRKTRENTSPPASSSSSRSKDKEAKDINKKSSRINKKRRAPVVSVSDDENDDIDNNNNNDNNTNEKTRKDVNQSVSLVSQSPNSKKKKKPIAKRRSLKEKSKSIIVEQSSDEEDDVCIIPKSQSTIVNVSPVTTNVTKEVDDSSDLIDPIEAELEANTLDFDVENENENDQDEQQQEEEEQLQKSVINIPKKTKQSKPKISSAATTAKRKERQTKAPPKVAKRTTNKTSNPRSTKKSNKENETIENDDYDNNNNNNDDVSEVTPINNNNRLSNSEEINDDNNEQQFDPDCSVMLISSSITKPNGEVITIPVDGDLPPPSTYTRTTRGRSRRNQTDTILFEPGNNNNGNNFISIYETLEKDIELLKETKKYVESGKAKNLIKVDAYKAPVTEYSTNNLLAKAEERKKVDMILAWGSIDAAKSINTTTVGNNNNNEGESDNNTSISSSPPVISCNSKSYTISPLFPGQDDDAESSFMGGGVIEFKPYGVKAYTQSLDVQLIFYILGGAVEVQVQDNIFTLTKGGSFTVPRGNGYSIKNVLKNKSKLFFVQAKDTEGSLKRKSIKRKRKD